MPRYVLKIDYHGGPFHGWQRQQAAVSVQGQIEAALRGLEPDLDLVYGAGRTDAGVHATGQVAHVDLAGDWDPYRLCGALNYYLKPDPIVILAIARVDDAFHARFDANQRRYLYRIRVRRQRLTHDAGLKWHVKPALDVAAMEDAARLLIGTHDFTTFRSTQCQARSPVKTLDRIEVTMQGEEVEFMLTARSFLHNQVRSIVGTLERVGAGAWTSADVTAALAARDRAACGPMAPSEGLYLTDVIYAQDPFADWAYG